METNRSWLVLTVVFLSACGHRAEPAAAGVQPLDPKVEHYGKTYAEWAAAWDEWVYEWPVTAECRDPVADQTGDLCTLYQDDTSPVFFLTGNWGGVSRRDRCKAPAGKALLVPILQTFQDNGGVPAASMKTDDQLKHSSELQADAMSDLTFSLDGQSLEPLDPYAIRAAPYEYTLPPEPNTYTCQGSPGVTGTYRGYTSGYFVLLPPLSSGPHRIAMSGQYHPAGEPLYKLDVSYDPIAIQ